MKVISQTAKLNLRRLPTKCSLFAMLGCATLIASPAYAASHLLSVGHNASDGSSGDVLLVQANDTFQVDLIANRSYACEAFAIDTASDFDWSQSVVGTSAGSPETVIARMAGALDPIVAGESGGTADNRITFTPTTTDRFRLTVQSAKSGGEFVRVRCLATTLYGGFNTNVNDFNYLELTNTSNGQISGTITAVTTDGTVVINAATFTIDPQRRFDIDIHSAAGADKYGLIRVTHNGPYDALKGVVSQYQGTSANFTLTATIPLTPVAQVP